MRSTPAGLRLRIGLLGRRNAGKSALLNALAGRECSLVNEQPGTTTDPVIKAMEWRPLGPVQLIDTAGLDDTGELGGERVRRTRQILPRLDLALLLAPAGCWEQPEKDLLEELRRLELPLLVLFSQSDRAQPDPGVLLSLREAGLSCIVCSAHSGEGLDALRLAVTETLLPRRPRGVSLQDLVPPGRLALLVAPIDEEAPAGRLIQPQVQILRQLLDQGSLAMLVRERELRPALAGLSTPPALVITDSQAFLKVAADTPEDVPLTSFSILFAREKGDLRSFVQGAHAIGGLRPGNRVLMAEACAHHAGGEDIARVKLPRWLRTVVGGELEFTHVRGHDFPAQLDGFSLVVHCGACSFGRSELLSRVALCRQQGVPITNFGVAIAWSLGIFPRALAPFPEVADLLPPV
ncbi:MAG: [FeFe] hydrogenase H-cluster maturation GTPase HydF [Calditrichaeota bacterium]|nr:[FeFe] hydrogenase H-cluster maturation GTPase HydF [Calditrichota bacterium]